MPRGPAETVIKIVVGFFLGIACYYAFENITAPEWTDSVEAAMEGCRNQGMGTRFRVKEHELIELECVPLEGRRESQQDGAEGSLQ